jgi:hypothetical protein
MRLFSKVKPGTAFAAEAQNSGHQIPKPAALNTDTEDNAREHQASGLFTRLSCSSHREAAPKTQEAKEMELCCWQLLVWSNRHHQQ